MATRTGSAEWRGDLKGGAGSVSVGDGVFQGVYSFSSRFEEGDGTNPEELIAAAHASCLAMALSNILAEHGHAPESVRATARAHLRNIDGAPLSRGSTSTSRRESPTSTRGTSASMPRRPRLAVRSRARSRACPRSSSAPDSSEVSDRHVRVGTKPNAQRRGGAPNASTRRCRLLP